jgi:hypothetical protein
LKVAPIIGSTPGHWLLVVDLKGVARTTAPATVSVAREHCGANRWRHASARSGATKQATDKPPPSEVLDIAPLERVFDSEYERTNFFDIEDPNLNVAQELDGVEHEPGVCRIRLAWWAIGAAS